MIVLSVHASILIPIFSYMDSWSSALASHINESGIPFLLLLQNMKMRRSPF